MHVQKYLQTSGNIYKGTEHISYKFKNIYRHQEIFTKGLKIFKKGLNIFHASSKNISDISS